SQRSAESRLWTLDERTAGRRRRARADRCPAQYRRTAQAPARAPVGRRAPARRARPGHVDETAAPAARRAAGIARSRTQTRNPAVSRAIARRGARADGLCQPPDGRDPTAVLAGGADRGRPRGG